MQWMRRRQPVAEPQGDGFILCNSRLHSGQAERSAKAEDGTVTKPAYVTVIHNGVVVHNHFELQGGTFYDRPASYQKHAEKLPIHIQFHGNPVKFRNIWLREIKPIEGKKPQ